ncbi:MAG: MmcQ/YjbR family DNA-binding protein [Chloroflexota bacterium]
MTFEETINELRAICLALPEASEGGGVGSPTFRVRDKIFAMQHPVQDRLSMWCKAPSGFQAMIVESDPEHFFVPPYVGKSGWIGIWLDLELDWDHIAGLVDESYRMTAPKRLLKLLPSNPEKS